MKFLVIGKAKDTVTMLPLPALRQLLEASQVVRDQQKKAGIILEDYMLAGQAKPMFIYECPTAEEFSKAMMEAPIAWYMDFEIYPLTDFSGPMSRMIEKLKEAEQRAAAAPK